MKSKKQPQAIDVKSIVGDRSFQRLQEAGIITGVSIRKTPPEELMSIAGIGVKKAVELYKAAGVKLNETKVQKLYNELHERTRFKRFKEKIKEVVTNPKPAIDSLEQTKFQISKWNEFLGALKNMGTGSSSVTARFDRQTPGAIAPKPYMPQTLVIDPFALNTNKIPENLLTAEMKILPKSATEIEVSYESADAANRTRGNWVETISSEDSVNAATEIINMIKETYDSYRKKTLEGAFIIVFDRSLGTYMNAVQEAFKNEIATEEEYEEGVTHKKMFLVPTLESYYDWFVIMKYTANNTMQAIARRFDDFNKYIQYEDYVREGGREQFSEWEANEDLDHTTFFEKIDEEFKSYIIVHTSPYGFMTKFGVIKGMPEMTRYEAGIEPINASEIPLERDLGYEHFQKMRQQTTTIIHGINLHPIMAAMVNSVLDKYRVFKYRDSLVFVSDILPEIGFLYKPGRI